MMSHHGDREQSANMRRLVDQINGTARREYPSGRMGAEDDGALSYAIASDVRHSTIVIRFGKPVVSQLLRLFDTKADPFELTERLMELRGVST